MNRIRIAWGILALLAGFAVFGHLSVTGTTQELENGLQQMEQCVLMRDYTAAAEYADTLLTLCDDRELLLTLFVKQDLYNTLRVSLVGLKPYLSEPYRSDLLMELSRTEACVTALRQQYFSFA